MIDKPQIVPQKELQSEMMYCRDGYFENHLFDKRLMKDNLIDRWPSADNKEYTFDQAQDARNLVESHV